MPSPSIDQAQSLLRSVFGFDAFRPGQEEVVGAALDGEDVLAVMPTGSGKSLCFQLPALVQPGLTVVVSPLIALMLDQTSQLREYGVEAYSLNSSLTAAEQFKAIHGIQEGTVKLLYMAPERLMREDTRTLLRDAGVRCMVVDEAHCVSQWGHDFRPEYLGLREAAEAMGNVQILAFTATADAPTRRDIVERLFTRAPRIFVRGFDRPNIRLAMSPKINAKRQILEFVARHDGASGIIYCSSRKGTEELARALRDAGVKALAYHAGMEQRDRQANQTAFQQDDGVVMVATIAFGMGIDKPDVRFVGHANLPKNIEGYYQEIGRAGRDGLPASTLTLYGMDDIRLRRLQIEDGEASEDQKRVEIQRLNALLSLCETPRCRRQTLLAYFDELSEPCGNCDLCETGCEVFDGSVDAQMAMSAMVRTGERFGTEHLVNVLTGKQTEVILRHGHHELPTYGVGKSRNTNEWRSIFRQIFAAGLISLDIVNHGRWAMTELGWKVLRGEQGVELRKDVLEARQTAKGKRKTPKERRAAGETSSSPMLLALKELRRELALQHNVPAYVIFGDKTLLEMDAYSPASFSDLERIHGVGKVKLEKYGQRFLDVIAESMGRS